MKEVRNIQIVFLVCYILILIALCARKKETKSVVKKQTREAHIDIEADKFFELSN
jgi:heme exporter protein D